MDIVEMIKTTVAGGTIIVALAAFWYRVLNQRSQNRLDVFHRYSGKYCELIASLLKETSFEGSFDPTSSVQREQAIKLFFLFSEEHYLSGQRLIEAKVWDIWKDGISALFRHKWFHEAWAYSREKCDFEGDFAVMIDNLSKVGSIAEKRAA